MTSFSSALSMRLKQLKLAGFKSFVDPTVVPFSSQLVAVVGPNGCGKSNIIDAVRWVMGESSAKNLRGESMVDVIFNGSSHRKPVGQASVELVFDNSLGRLLGQYAGYEEIAVKRLVTRDGDSFYYLNGSRCRRRDITDIFLGTGAGARGYAIIGQDTISRIIEARPEELRAYLEEAAGVSKYKERRRETLQRIGHTRDNLARVADIRDELEKQLSRLERQAKAAQYYTSLKEEERRCQVEIMALKWQAITLEQATVRHALNTLTLEYETYQTQIAGFAKESIQLRDTSEVAQARFQQVQLNFYQMGTDIARLEETMQQQQRERQQLEIDKYQIEHDLNAAVDQLQRDQATLKSSEDELIIVQEKMSQLSIEWLHNQATFNDQQRQKNHWDNQWQEQQKTMSHMVSALEVEQVRLQYLEQQWQQVQIRLDKIQQEQAAMTLEPIQDELNALALKQLELSQQQQNDEQASHACSHRGIALRAELSAVELRLHQAQDQVQKLVTQHAGLLAAQNEALRKQSNGHALMPQWQSYPRVAEVLTIAHQWLKACELVLGDGLQAIVLESTATLWSDLPVLKEQTAVFVQQTSASKNKANYPRLSDYIVGEMPCWLNGLDDIFAAENVDDAIAWLADLDKHQSVVTPDGYWFGPGWVRISGVALEDDVGVLGRQQMLTSLSRALDIAQKNQLDLQAARDKLHAEWVENEGNKNALFQTSAQSLEELRAFELEIHSKKQRLEHARMQQTRWVEEYDDLGLILEEHALEKINLSDIIRDKKQTIAQQQEQLLQCIAEKNRWEEILAAMGCTIDAARSALHQAELEYKEHALKTQQLRDNITREQRQITTLQERAQRLMHRYTELANPDVSLQNTLNDKINQHRQLDTELSQQRHVLEELQHQLNQYEQASKQVEQDMRLLQEKIQQEQLREQSLLVRATTLVEALTELDQDGDALLAEISSEVTLIMREQALVALTEKINRLGAINLVAIEEYQIELERKRNLDEQSQDLIDALATLESAITKMDKETELRLKETFEQVNLSFQTLFPRLFGGGHARLELTCDNLLDAGVLVMAQPPGKRNSTIYMLSGGEKAMTAVALVFAIFQQNPSPFCMLDEVDAPLDDLNVRRFCDLVKEMSQFVQFLFITHNKVTMELADHLIGVTMREPGVSRIVAVDVEEALSMAE